MPITKEQFAAYERVRQGGRYNMVMDAQLAMRAARLTHAQYWEIIRNYSVYMAQWPDVRRG